jgi:sortase A
VRPSTLRSISIATGAIGVIVIACSVGIRLWLGWHGETALAQFELSRAAAADAAAGGGPAGHAAMSGGPGPHTAVSGGAAGRAAGAAAAVQTASSGGGRPSAGRPDQSLWSVGRIRAYRDALGRFSARPTAVLEIPSVGVRAPVYAGTSAVDLALGAGLIEGTPPPGSRGNVGIAAHRDGYFRPLEDVEVGADVVIETPEKTYRYEITEIGVVDPDEVEVLHPTPVPALTLVTCYPFYFVGPAPRRFVVRAYLAP